jgi:hypothetical protein
MMKEKAKIEKSRPVLQTTNLPRPVEGMVFDVVQPTKRLVSGADLILDAAQWLERNATPEELATFKASVQARLERGAATGWRELPGGHKIKADSILATCSKCRRWAWTSPGHETAACAICNFRNLSDDPGRVVFDKNGGFMRPASPKEIKAWYSDEEARLAKIKADAPKRAAMVKAANLARRATEKD